jgi:hypothetical protein
MNSYKVMMGECNLHADQFLSAINRMVGWDELDKWTISQWFYLGSKNCIYFGAFVRKASRVTLKLQNCSKLPSCLKRPSSAVMILRRWSVSKWLSDPKMLNGAGLAKTQSLYLYLAYTSTTSTAILNLDCTFTKIESNWSGSELKSRNSKCKNFAKLQYDAEVCTGVSTGRGALENFFLLDLLMLRNKP